MCKIIIIRQVKFDLDRIFLRSIKFKDFSVKILEYKSNSNNNRNNF